MGKHEAPAFRMTIERGKLVPATPYDAERLDTYRHGMLVYVRFTEDKDRVLVRKWWAIIGRAVKDCKTPWKTRDEASEAIKLALGIVNLTKTVGGDYLAYPKSLTELDDPELQEAVDQMKQIIFNVTGVDPDEWRKELAGLDDVEQESSEGPSPADEGSGDLVPPDMDPAAAEIASQGVNGEAEQSNVGDGPAASSASSDPIVRNLSAECLDKFMAIATDAKLSVQERRDNLEFAKEPWKEALPTRHDFVKACLTTADKVAKGELGADAARRYLDGLI
jgi:hypothetical protein